MTNGEEAGKAGGIRSSKLKLAIIVVVAIAISGVGGMEIMEYMSRDATCGAICHNHQPIYDEYQGTAHQSAGVACVECHEQSGAVGFVKNQIVNSGNMFKYYILRGKYRKDFDVIMADEPRENFVPPDKNCMKEDCHAGGKFILTGDTRGYDFVRSEDAGKLISAVTNERNTEGILTLHQLHLQNPSVKEAPWLEYTLRGKSGEWTSEPTCFDCHGNVMAEERFDEAYLGNADAVTSGAFPLRSQALGGTRQKIPIVVCLKCHDGVKAPGIYGEYGGPFPG